MGCGLQVDEADGVAEVWSRRRRDDLGGERELAELLVVVDEAEKGHRAAVLWATGPWPQTPTTASWPSTPR